jgi:hypothetical protein
MQKAGHSARQAYIYLEDIVDITQSTIIKTGDNILYNYGLSLTSRIPRTFYKFQDLPTEIRNEIWQYCLPGPRVIEIRNNRDIPGATSICRIPPILHVCRESREMALKIYELSFGMDNQPGQIWVNFERDIVYFGAKSDFYVMQALSQDGASIVGRVKGLEKIKALALRSRVFGETSRFNLRHFKGLREIVLVGQDRFVRGQPAWRMFNLGKEPTLIERPVSHYFFVDPECMHHMFDLEAKMETWQERFPDWEKPELKFGIFSKGRGDRFCSERHGQHLLPF